MNYPELLPNGPYGPEFGRFGQVVRNVEVECPIRFCGQFKQVIVEIGEG